MVQRLGYWYHLSRHEGDRGVKLTAHIHLVLRLRISGVVRLVTHPPHVTLERTQEHFGFTIPSTSSSI